MTESERIITLARRYCINNFRYWADRYQKERKGDDLPYDYLNSDYNLFPRYQSLDAILKGVETLVGKIFTSTDQCKAELKVIGLSSQTPFTTGNYNEIHQKAIEDERQKFINFIDQIETEQLDNVKPLPYRRRLLEGEANKIRETLNKHWNFDGGYWEPLVSCSPAPVVFFNKLNLSNADYEKIKEIVSNGADKRLFEVNEDLWDYEIDHSEFNPDCYETVYTDKNFDWIIYGSHEETIAFGGTWLLAELKKKFK